MLLNEFIDKFNYCAENAGDINYSVRAVFGKITTNELCDAIIRININGNIVIKDVDTGYNVNDVESVKYSNDEYAYPYIVITFAPNLDILELSFDNNGNEDITLLKNKNRVRKNEDLLKYWKSHNEIL